VVIRSVRLILEFAIGASIGAVILIGLILWHLSGEAVSLPFLTPYLERALSAEDGSFTVRLDTTVLKWEGWERTLDIRMLGVKAIGREGQVLASVPDIAVSLSARGLLHGVIAPTSLEILSPRLRLVRSADGSFQLGIEGQGAAAGDILGRLVTDLLAPPDLSRAMGYLSQVRVTNADLKLVDEKLGTTWHAPRASLTLFRDQRGIAGDLGLELDLAGETAEIDAKLGYDRQAQKVELGASFQNLDPSRLGAKELPVPGLTGVAVPLRGTLTSTIDIDGNVLNLGFDVTGGPGRVKVTDVYPEPLAVQWLELRGRAEEDLSRLVVDQAFVDLGGPTVDLNGQVYRAGGGATAQGEVLIKNMPVDELSRYWPAAVGMDAREWVLTHLSKGKVEESRAVFAAKMPDDDPKAAAIESLAGTLKADGVTVAYLPPMQPAEGVSARASFTADRFDIWILGGSVQGLKLDQGTVKITGLDKKDQFADIEIVVKGPVRDAIQVLDGEPLEAAKFLGVSPADLGGESATRGVFSLPLVKDLQLADVKLAAASNLRGLSIRHAALGQDVTDGVMTLRADKAGLQAQGTLKLGGIPGSLTMSQNFGPQVAFRSRYMVTARPTDADLARIGFPVAPYAVGPVGLGLTYTVADGGAADLQLAADLGQTALDFKDIGWSKPAGVPGSARAAFSLADNRVTALRDFALTAGTMTAAGNAAFAVGKDGVSRVQKLSFGRLAFGRTDVAGTVVFREAGGFDVDVNGPAIDLSEQFSPKEAGKPKTKEKGPPFTVRATARTLWVGPDRSVRNANLQIENDGLRIRALTLTGDLVDGKAGADKEAKADAQTDVKTPTPFEIRLTPDGQVRRLAATSNDAGRMLKTFGIFDDMVGGRLTLAGEIDDKLEGSPFKGRLTVKDYRIVNTPVLAEILTAASLTGIVNVLSGEGIGFTDLDAPVALKDDTLTITDARAYGPDLGLTMKGTINIATNDANLEGTIVPAYAINSILGNIPVVGELLTGEKGGGIFAATYSVQGPLSKPKVLLNPLAALTPGFLRNLFGIFTGPEAGANQKPGAPESKPNATPAPSPSPNPNPPSGPPR
jgi:hypothetical protein